MLRPALPFALVLLAGSAQAAPGGQLNTMLLGSYQCETGGDATGLAGIHQPDQDFRVTRASTYQIGDSKTEIGTYLMTSARVVFTSGPRAGEKFRQLRPGFLRRSEADGTDGALRCVRRPGSNY